MFDACWHTITDAIYVGQAVQEMGFIGMKTPFPAMIFMDMYGSKPSTFQSETELPATGPKAYAPWIMNQATDYLRGDVAIKVV